MPPRFSAIKINGERAYDIARDGETPELKARAVYIHSLILLDAREHDADFEMVCGKGTYVRSLARDLGEFLGTKGYVSALRRTKVGPFTAENAISLDIFDETDYVAARSKVLLPLDVVLDDIPALTLQGDETAKLRNGQVLHFVSKPDFDRLTKVGLGQKEETLALAIFKDKPVALIENTKVQIKPVRVFNI